MARSVNQAASKGAARDVRLFLSAVTDEFRSYRDILRARLTRPNVSVRVQEDFIASGTDTLVKLDDYIARCDAVIHLVGDMPGALARATALQALRPDLVKRLPFLSGASEQGAPQFSYTQWEAYLAAYHGKRLVIAKADPAAPRDEKFRKEPLLQQSQVEHLQRLQSIGRHAEVTFVSHDQLAAEILRSAVLDLLVRAEGRPAFWSRRRALVAGVAGTTVVGAAAIAARLSWPVLFPQADPRAIAILPFENNTGNAGLNPYLSSVPIDLGDVLSRLDPDLMVRSHDSVQSLIERNVPRNEFSRLLEVAHLVSGAFAFAEAGAVNLTVQAQDARNDLPWSRSLTIDPANPLQWAPSLYDQVAGLLHLNVQTGQVAEMIGAGDGHAYDLYLKALDLQLALSQTNNSQAITQLEEAVRQSPGFAQAHAALAMAYLQQFYWFDSQSSIDQGLGAAQRAVALAPKAPDSRFALGYAYECKGQREDAIGQYCAVLAANPNYPPAVEKVATFLFYGGWFDASFDGWNRVQILDPPSDMPKIRQAMCCFFKGDKPRAERLNETAEKEAYGLNELTLVAFTYAWLQNSAFANRLLERLRREHPTASQIDEVETWLSVLQAQPDARQRVDSFAQEHGVKYGNQDQIATWYAILGDTEPAIAWLTKALANGAPNYAWYASDFFVKVKQDARYAALMKRLSGQYDSVKPKLFAALEGAAGYGRRPLG
ncbi:MAG: hypothetical protein ACRDQZ_14295 [Mycobacteriales bacterium]